MIVMRKIFFILSFLELQFVAHAQTNYNKDAWELYMKLETMTAQLHEKGNAWTDKFNELYKVNKNYDQLTPLRKNIAHFIDSSIAEITNMKDKIPGSNDLRAGYKNCLHWKGLWFKKRTYLLNIWVIIRHQKR